MSELADYIDAQLTAAFHQKVVDYGYWCPRCDVYALPIDDDAVLGVTPGWCSFCGLDPLVEGPTRPSFFVGIFGLRPSVGRGGRISTLW